MLRAMNLQYAIEKLGESEAARIYGYVSRINDLKLKPYKREYQTNIDGLMRHYTFKTNEPNETINADLLLINGVVVKNVDIDRNAILALTIMGGIVIQNKKFQGGNNK